MGRKCCGHISLICYLNGGVHLINERGMGHGDKRETRAEHFLRIIREKKGYRGSLA